MGRGRVRTTDVATTILYGSFIVTLSISVILGGRLVADGLDALSEQALDWISPEWLVRGGHIPTIIVLLSLALGTTLSIAFSSTAISTAQTSLSARIRSDRARLMGMQSRGPMQCRAINVALSWCLFLTLIAQCATGGLLYLGYGGRIVAAYHFGMWVILFYAASQVLTHWRLGGATRLLRVLRASRLAPPPQPFTPAGPQADLPVDLLNVPDRLRPARARCPDDASKFDTPITSNTFMWIVAFGHPQTRRLRPVRLEVE